MSPDFVGEFTVNSVQFTVNTFSVHCKLLTVNCTLPNIVRLIWGILKVF